MSNLSLSNQQVIDLVKQLPPERKRDVLLALAVDAQGRRHERMKLAEEQLRRLSASRGLDWDSMNDEQREEFIDNLVHEDRQCGP